jgi:hypothetical protein
MNMSNEQNQEGKKLTISFAVYEKLSADEARTIISAVSKWFVSNPRRRVCRTSWFNIKRCHVEEEVMKQTKDSEKEKLARCCRKEFREECHTCEEKFDCWTKEFKLIKLRGN